MKCHRAGIIAPVVAMLTILLLCGSASTQALVCDSDPPSTLAFVGVLTELSTVGSQSTQWHFATFHVNELLAGDPKSESIAALMRRSLCGRAQEDPTVGHVYLVKTHLLRTGTTYQLEHCDQVQPVEAAFEEIEYFRNSQKGIASTEVDGEATVETGGYPWKRIGLPSTKIHLSSPQQQLDLVSDEDGRFHAELKPGTYSMATIFPAGYSDRFCGATDLMVLEHRCTQVHVCAYSTASFAAHLTDADGEPLDIMSGVQLTVETAEDQQFVLSVWPNENGNLVAKDLLPGKYILGLNTYLPVNRGSAPYPPTYFPGVSRRSDATVIVLDPGEHKNLPEMKIKKGRQCEIPVVVTDVLGKPSSSAQVALAYSDYPHFYVEPLEQTDQNGKNTVYGVFPGPLLLRAERQLQNGSTEESESVELDSCPNEPVVLRLTHVVPPQTE